MATKPAAKELIGFLMGDIFERQKKYDQAETEFKTVLAMNPNDAATLNYYGYMLADRDIRLDEATKLVQRALAEDPNNPAYLDSLGWAYYKQDKLQEAEQWLRKAVNFDSHDPTILGHLADVYFKSGRTDLAAANWQKSLDEWHHSLPGRCRARQNRRHRAEARRSEAPRGATSKLERSHQQAAVISLGIGQWLSLKDPTAGDGTLVRLARLPGTCRLAGDARH